MSAAAATPALEPWPVVPDTLTGPQLLAKLAAMSTEIDPATEERVYAFAHRHRTSGHVTEVVTADREEARAAGGHYLRTIIRKKQQGGGR